MKQFLINTINHVVFYLGLLYGQLKPKSRKADVYFFLPLATIGGVELVHLDILKALKGQKVKSVFWNRFSPFIAGSSALETIDQEYAKFGDTLIFEDLAKSRFQQWAESFAFGTIWSEINRKGKVVILRNGDEKFKYFLRKFGLKKKFNCIVITHNAYEEFFGIDELKTYLDLDIQAHIDRRVLISDSLSTVIERTRVALQIPQKVTETVIYNAVEAEASIPGKDFKQLDILFAGRDVQEKRFYLIYEIAQALQDRSDIRFHFAGPDQAAYPDAPQMTFYGEVKDQAAMHALYQRCNVFILLSKSEGFPRSIAEAMLTGSVIVTTKVGSIHDHISEDNGLLLDGMDDAEMKEAVIHFLQSLLHNPEAEGISARNKAYAESHFSTAQFKAKYAELIAEFSA